MNNKTAKDIKENRKRKLWSRKWLLRRNSGRDHSHLVMKELQWEDEISFQNFTKMTKQTFGNLLNKVEPLISKQNTNLREAIPAHTRLLITLRFLATGQTYRALSYDFRVSVPAISDIVPITLNVICTVLKDDYLKVPNTKNQWKKIASEFEKQWNFPNCLGALDGKHIAFRAKKEDGSYYYNYKGFNSIILLALVDANYRFLYVDVGCNGRSNDAGVYANSALCAAIKDNLLDFPEDNTISGSPEKFPYVIVSDDAFKLTKRMMKPYGLRKNEREKIYNYRHGRARRVVENTFGILPNKFQILQKDINLDVGKVELITFTCCILHNYIRTEDGLRHIDGVDQENTSEITLTSGMWRKEVFVTPLCRNIANRSGNEGLDTRDRYCTYFNTVGYVPWQWEAVKKFNF